MIEHVVCRLVKGEDLNHHGTLFAGRMSEWFVEASFISAASLYKKPEHIVCLKVHGLQFLVPINKGAIINITTKVVHVGNTSITTYGRVVLEGEDTTMVDGYITFVTVDHDGNKMPHHLAPVEAADDRERKLQETARQLR
ncbi:acyl-CoA thioesterase [Anaerotalea alkaliphila]|uniref:Acyl-CoA thioesterase n=1 Tax=Anaerotalea alkaliphila TaxID=2662126 RepID=A0A7X5KL20_9FIRM|nr:hotdog domain-containing protein [Anaerotalea alkaliphila]NDL66244.1 acyl-CoA thioesterase [Anaerotalea alkaliphila]